MKIERIRYENICSATGEDVIVTDFIAAGTEARAWCDTYEQSCTKQEWQCGSTAEFSAMLLLTAPASLLLAE